MVFSRTVRIALWVKVAGSLVLLTASQNGKKLGPMNKQPTPKLDALRAMREARYGNRQTPKAPASSLRIQVAEIPAKKREKVKKPTNEPTRMDWGSKSSLVRDLYGLSVKA